MKRSVLNLTKNENGDYHSVFKNNHGRRIYICLSIDDCECEIVKCFYVDRSSRPEPKKLKSLKFHIETLLNVCANELDKVFVAYELVDGFVLSCEELILAENKKEKYNILIFVHEDDLLKTIFKNKYHRSIYLEIKMFQDKALIKTCRYCDNRGEDTDVTPYSLTTIYFDFSFANLLKIINNELEGGFTDVVITENHTIILDRPICGSI